MRVFFLAVLFVPNSIYSQQNIVSGSYTYNYQFNLFEKDFVGRIQVISNFSLKNYNNPGPDTVNYISDKSGLFDAADTSKFNLDNMFEGIHFDYNDKSQSFVDKAGRIMKVSDTSYSYRQDSFIEKILFYPKYKYFVLKQSKNMDTTYRYMIREFDGGKSIKKITYYNGKHKNIPTDSILLYLVKTKFSEIYEFTYKKINASKRITAINYYRSDEKNGKKLLYASNRYFYGKNNLVSKIMFVQFNGVARINGEIFFSYFPNANL